MSDTATVTVTCPNCGAVFDVPAPRNPRQRHFMADCPECGENVVVTWQPPVGPAERKAAGRYEMLTPAGRFLGEYDVQRKVITLPYRGNDYEFDLAHPEAWPKRN